MKGSDDASERMEAYWDTIRHSKPLSREEERKCALRIRAGDTEARQLLIEANLRFVTKIAREYTGGSLSLLELISEGNLGLIKAADRFDPDRGIKFISYAVWWIRQAITESLSKTGRIAPQPYNRRVDWRAMVHGANRLSQDLGRQPTLNEVIDGLSLSERRILNALEAVKAEISPDAPLSPDENNTFGDTLANIEEKDVLGRLEGEDLKLKLDTCMASLEPREFQVLAAYFGLGGQEPLTMEEIGEELGLTRERIRQVRNKALLKMRKQGGQGLRQCI